MQILTRITIGHPILLTYIFERGDTSLETNKQNEIRDAYEHSAQVQCIPASIKKNTEHSEEDPLMVAPYCRVSTDSKDQLASYELQCQYYKEYVSKHPGWRLYDIYADAAVIIGLKTLRLKKSQKHAAF